MQKIIPFLWFDDKAQEAAKFYTSVFKNSGILDVARYDAESAKASGMPKGSVMTVRFRIEGQDFIALNGGPVFTFSQAISFLVDCSTQQEVDRLWNRLSAGGEKQQCGWLRDKYGVSWQVVPSALDRMLRDKNAQKAQRVMKAMLAMKKIDIKALKKAYAGK